MNIPKQRKILDTGELTPISSPGGLLLIPLKLPGIGTSDICSLTSYISQLAIEHSVSVNDLLSRFIVPCLQQFALQDNKIVSLNSTSDIWSFSKSLNGINGSTSDLVSVLSRLTGNVDLSFATMLKWGGVIDRNKLVRANHAWCAQCYDDQMRNNGPVYDLLLWSLQCVNICLKHNRLLTETCPYDDCKRTFRRLSRHYVPGFCPYCKYSA